MAHQSLSPDVAATFPWQRHYDVGVPPTVEIPSISLPQLLADAASNCGDRAAILFYGNKLTYLQLELAADRFARALRGMGIGHGDRVAICLPNVPQFPIAFYGVLKAGAIAVPTNPLYTPHEMQHQLTDAGARAFITLDSLYHTFHEVRDKVPVEHVIITQVQDYLPMPLALLYPIKELMDNRGKPSHAMPDKADPKIVFLKDLLEREKAQRGGYALIDLPAPAAPDDLAVLQYTGGTTGLSKGAMLSHRNLVANAIQCAVWPAVPRFEAHTALLAIPFFHVYGLTIGLNMSIYNASTMILLPRFIPKDVLHTIEEYRPDIFPGIPTMYLAIAKELEKRGKGAKIDSVKTCLSGAAPLLQEVQQRFERVSGAKIAEGYGLSEASPVTHSNPLKGDMRMGTIGLPMPGTEARIVDPATDAEQPHGERGELVIRGPQVMAGYWNRAEETAKTLRDGWLHTGDIGIQDDDGYFTIVDRAKDLIIAGGYNIYPREVEEVLVKHPAVADAVVIGIPDEYRGETVRAYIVLREGMKATPEEIIAFSRQDLAAYKAPKQIVFRDSLPKTLVGKVLRRQLREEALAELSANKTQSGK